MPKFIHIDRKSGYRGFWLVRILVSSRSVETRGIENLYPLKNAQVAEMKLGELSKIAGGVIQYLDLAQIDSGLFRLA